MAHSHSTPANKMSSTSSERLTREIARDRPDVLEEMKAGKYPSTRAAAKAAGIIKEVSPLQALKRAWGKASEEEREEAERTQQS